MSRKNVFSSLGKFSAASNLEQAAKAPDRPLADVADQLSAAAAPVGSLGRVLREAKQKSARADEMERAFQEGAAIVELSPADIDPSFARDRMAGFGPEDLDEGFLASIRDNGQQVPVLVRPHSTKSGRYETAYGHRRIAAARVLGRPVRAVVRALSDDELVVAQGQENVERNGLSFIEKCRFAHALESRSFTRETIGRALSVHKTILSIMISLIERLPADVINAVGPAPATGRRAWSLLADQLDAASADGRVREMIASKEFAAANSDGRFRMLLAAATTKAATIRKEAWKRADGSAFASLAIDDRRIVLSVDRAKYPEVAQFVLDRLSELQEELQQASSRAAVKKKD
jgi:ParB family chromosome partitioning protein